MEDVIGALPKKLENAKEFKTKIEEHFQGSSMANASMHAKYDGHGSVREHILNLKDLEMPLPEPYLVDYIMLSLHAIFDNFKINYNGSDNKWTLAELIAKCKMTENKDFVNFVGQDLGKNPGHEKSARKSSHHKKGKGKKPYDALKNNAPKDGM
jgi:hypothetical protein